MDYYKDYLDRLIINEGIFTTNKSFFSQDELVLFFKAALSGGLGQAIQNKANNFVQPFLKKAINKQKRSEKVSNIINAKKYAQNTKNNIKDTNSDMSETFLLAASVATLSENQLDTVIKNIINRLKGNTNVHGFMYESLVLLRLKNNSSIKDMKIGFSEKNNDPLADLFFSNGQYGNYDIQCKFSKVPTRFARDFNSRFAKGDSLKASKHYGIISGNRAISYFYIVSDEVKKILEQFCSDPKFDEKKLPAGIHSRDKRPQEQKEKDPTPHLDLEIGNPFFKNNNNFADISEINKWFPGFGKTDETPVYHLTFNFEPGCNEIKTLKQQINTEALKQWCSKNGLTDVADEDISNKVNKIHQEADKQEADVGYKEMKEKTKNMSDSQKNKFYIKNGIKEEYFNY